MKKRLNNLIDRKLVTILLRRFMVASFLFIKRNVYENKNNQN